MFSALHITQQLIDDDKTVLKIYFGKVIGVKCKFDCD